MKRPVWTQVVCLPALVIAGPAYAVDYLSIAQAQELLFPEAQAFEKRPVEITKELRQQIKSLSGVRQRWDMQEVWLARKDGGPLGWFLVDDVIGKHEFITYGVALSLDGEVLGIEILSYRETHGGEIRRAEWRDHFKGKVLDEPFRLDEDIPNIAGATLSCRNVTDGVKRLLALHHLVLSRQIDD